MVVLRNCISEGLCSGKKCISSVFFKAEVCLALQLNSFITEKPHLYCSCYIMGTKLNSTVNFMGNPNHK